MWKSGTCAVIRSDMITLYGSCLLWNVWLSGLWWSGLTLYSRLYLGKLWECLFLCLPVWKLCRTLFSDICCWSCMILWLCGLSGLCVLLLIYPSILVWYRWVGVLLIFAPFRFCRKGWMWFNCTLTGKIARYDKYNMYNYIFSLRIFFDSSRILCGTLINIWYNFSKIKVYKQRYHLYEKGRN